MLHRGVETILFVCRLWHYGFLVKLESNVDCNYGQIVIRYCSDSLVMKSKAFLFRSFNVSMYLKTFSFNASKRQILKHISFWLRLLH